MSALPQLSSTLPATISIEKFERGDVDAKQFDHEAHIFVAWSYLQNYELQESIARFCKALRALTKKLGVESKYHETISWFFMILIAERKAASKDWQTFKRLNADLFASQPSIISAYYSSERLGSPLARTQFMMPDRLPLT
jgi:hypothetical protein